MKKGIIALIVIVAILAIVGFALGPKFYNTGIDLQENAVSQWANVESSYQRRADHPQYCKYRKRICRI